MDSIDLAGYRHEQPCSDGIAPGTSTCYLLTGSSCSSQHSTATSVAAVAVAAKIDGGEMGQCSRATVA